MSSQGFSLSDAVSGGLPGMAKYVAGPMQKQGAEIEKKELEATDTLKTDLTENQAKRDALMAKAKEPGGGLTPPQLQPPPQQAQTNPLQIWGSSAMWIAALGGLLTRRPLINSLNASAAVLNAYKQHDKEATDAAFDTWKVENENALKMSQFAIDSLKTQLEAVDTDDRTKLSNFNVTQKALNGLDAFQAKSVDEALRVTEAIQAHKDRMAEAGRRINGNKPVMDAKLDALNAVKTLQAARQTRDPQKIAAATQGLKDANERLKAIEGKGTSAADAKAAANAPLYDAATREVDKAIAMVDSLGYGSAGAANRARLQDMIRKTAKAQGMSGGDIAAHMAEFSGMAAGERTLSTTQARIGLGAAEIQQLEPQVLEASKQLQRTNYPSFNALIQAGQRETGDPALKNLAVRLQGLKSAFSQVLTRGGVPTDSARATTDELFNTKDPPRVMQQAMDAMNAETGAIEKAPGMVRKQLRENISSDKPDSTRGPAPAHLHGKPIWPEGDHWVYEDGSPAK